MTVLWLFRRELMYLALFVTIAAILSYFTGYFIYILLLVLCAILIRHAVLLSRLERWLSRGAGGKVPVISGVWGDIYYHFYRIKKNEKSRKKKLGKIIEQFRKSTDVLPDAAIVLGNYDEIEWSNKLAKVILGVKKHDKGQRIDNLIRTPEFADFLKRRDEKEALIIASPVNSQIILQCRLVTYAEGQHLFIAQDVTQQRNMELMRKTFVDNVSHELRTPLTVLKGYLETLQDTDDKQSAMLTQSLTQMYAQTERMQYLVDDLLLLARLETQKKQRECVDACALIRRICLEGATIEKSRQRIELSMKSECNIFGEEHDLQSAFTNILINALKYSADDTPVKVIWRESELGLIFEVIDKGEGIAQENIARLTERFYRVDVRRSKKLSGTGLGLAIVKHVLMRHDARLEITSKLGKGSRFRCIFPNSLVC